MLFVCVITAPGEAVEDVRSLDVGSDGVACDQAMTLARRHSPYHGYQIWRGGRKIAAFFAPRVMSALASHRTTFTGTRGRA